MSGNLINYSLKNFVKLVSFSATIGLFSASQAGAVNLFSPKLKINDAIVTQYEFLQRQEFLKLLNAPGDIPKLASEQLTNESLQKQAAKKLGVKPDENAIKAGTVEFAGRFKMEVPEFLDVLSKGGVAPESFRDFVSAGILWRNVIQKRFQGAIKVEDDEINHEIERITNPPNIKVLLSEIVLVPQSADQLEGARQFATQFKNVKSSAQFSEFARQYSSAASRDQGGKLEWLKLSNLPSELQNVLLSLRPGEVSDPLMLGNGVTVLQLRNLQELTTPAPRNQNLEYAVISAAGVNQSEAASVLSNIAQRAARCDDLYGLTKALGPDAVTRESQNISNVPSGLAISLAKIDPGETVMLPDRKSVKRMVMLCERQALLPKDVTRQDISLRLQNKKIDSYAGAYLEELRAQAHISEF